MKLIQQLARQSTSGTGNVKIQRKELHVMIITAQTIESMFKFLGLEPDDTRYK